MVPPSHHRLSFDRRRRCDTALQYGYDRDLACFGLVALGVLLGCGSPSPSAPSSQPAAAPVIQDKATNAGDGDDGKDVSQVDQQVAAERAFIASALSSVELDSDPELSDLTLELAGHWLEQANEGQSPEEQRAVLKLLRGDLAAAMKGREAESQGEVLRREVFDRRARKLGRASFALAKAVVDGTSPAEQARPQGQELLARAKTLQDDVLDLRDQDTDAVRSIRRELENVMLEAAYAMDQGPMSLRLSRYAADKGSGPKVSP